MNFKPLLASGLLMGAGLGGLADGILFHQILQLHNMLSARIPPDTILNMKVNMLWDGLFHALAWTATAIALAMLWDAGKRRNVPWNGRAYFGAILVGWGLFNLVEGLIDHYLLGIHHVVEAVGLSIYDYGFLASGIALCAIGLFLFQSAVMSRSGVGHKQAA